MVTGTIRRSQFASLDGTGVSEGTSVTGILHNLGKASCFENTIRSIRIVITGKVSYSERRRNFVTVTRLRKPILFQPTDFPSCRSCSQFTQSECFPDVAQNIQNMLKTKICKGTTLSAILAVRRV